jgi:phage terminase large subunit-like protein
VLEDLKRTLGSYDFLAQYQQTPAPPGGAMVKLAWFSRYRQHPGYEDGDMIVQSWDTAAKATEISNFSVCTTWYMRKDEFYLLDVFRARLDYPSLKRKVVELNQRYGCMRMPIKADRG